METNDVLISLLAVRELELKELHIYLSQLEAEINSLTVKYNKLYVLHYTKEKKTIGFKQGGRDEKR